MQQLGDQPNDALIVAGDVCTSIKKLREALALITKKFSHVFYCVGNHELWTHRGGPHSVDKLVSILHMCAELGVHVAPTRLGDTLVVVPLQGWHSGEGAPVLMEHERTFDSMCMWPPSVGDPMDTHNSVGGPIPKIHTLFESWNLLDTHCCYLAEFSSSANFLQSVEQQGSSVGLLWSCSNKLWALRSRRFFL